MNDKLWRRAIGSWCLWGTVDYLHGEYVAVDTCRYVNDKGDLVPFIGHEACEPLLTVESISEFLDVDA